MRFNNANSQRAISFLLFFLLFGFYVSAQPKKKKDIQKLNYTIVFDLYLNFELSNKNGNLSTLIDYMPDFKNKSVQCESIESNMGHEEEIIEFSYKDNQIAQVSYIVRNRIFKYGIGYLGDKVDHMTIAGKKKIRFSYDSKGRISKIERDMGGGTMEYTLEYQKGENNANIVVHVIQGESRKKSPRKYHVIWNDDLKLKDYKLDVFTGHDFEYTADGLVKSFKFSNVNRDNIPIVYEYKHDEKGSWIERSSSSAENFYFRRKLKYL